MSTWRRRPSSAKSSSASTRKRHVEVYIQTYRESSCYSTGFVSTMEGLATVCAYVLHLCSRQRDPSVKGVCID